jgi:menaquinone-dependent protoporphyrinogen oxidase
MKDQTRRKFLIHSAKTTGAIIGATTLGKELLLPQTTEAANVQFPESICNSKNSGSHKFLIAYASQFGTTGEVAEAIGEVLCQAGNTVETKWVKNVKDLSDYDAVIIGSAIQYDSWMSEAEEFVTANKNILNKLPVAYFFTCLALAMQSGKGEKKAMTFSDRLYALVPQVKPVCVGRFAGVLDYSKMPFLTLIVLKVMLSILGVKEGDYRDWDAIRAWAKDTQLKLNQRRIS